MLEALTNDVDAIFSEFGWDWSFGSPVFKTRVDFLAIATELDRFDGIRYLTRTDGAAVLPANFRFDLFQFCEGLDSVLEALELRVFAVEAELQRRQEMRAALQP